MPRIIDDKLIIGEILHSWRIKEYERHERPTAWYVLMGVLGALLVGYGIFSGNFLFALIVVLFAIILFLQSHQEPSEFPFCVTELGVCVNNRFYPYSELGKFYLIYNPPDVKMLFIDTLSPLRPALRIPLNDDDPNAVRHTLRGYLQEDVEKEEEPFGDMLARRWKIH